MNCLSHPVFRVFHWGPLIALSIIFSVSICTVSCLGQWHNTREAFFNLAAGLHSRKDLLTESISVPNIYSSLSPYFTIIFLIFSALTLYHYLQAMWGGPGNVPLRWRPEAAEDEAKLQYCAVCCAFKPPRAHHCRQCGRCIPKMDHHCPWINTCVGHRNHAHFTVFLISAVIGCTIASLVLGPSVYFALYRRWYLYSNTSDVPIIFLSVWGLVINMFVLGLAIGVVVAVGLLFYFQVKTILRNRTAIEDWILEKANHRRAEADEQPFVFPYNLGTWANISEVFSDPFCRVKGDGITWTVRPGCNQYTLTMEQLEQKACKRARSIRCVIRREYSGAWLPVTHGLCVLLHPPCTDEPRLRLRRDDIVVVTRWKKYWVYGDRPSTEQLTHDQFLSPHGDNTKDSVPNGESMADQQKSSGKVQRHRGWFPRHCAVPLVDDCVDYLSRIEEKKTIIDSKTSNNNLSVDGHRTCDEIFAKVTFDHEHRSSAKLNDNKLAHFERQIEQIYGVDSSKITGKEPPVKQRRKKCEKLQVEYERKPEEEEEESAAEKRRASSSLLHSDGSVDTFQQHSSKPKRKKKNA